MSKFFHAENSNRRITAPSGREFVFDPYSFVGSSWSGVLSVSDPADIADLLELVADKRSAVTEIDEADYRKCVAKKVQLPEVFRNSNSVTLVEAQNQSQAALLVGDTVSSEPRPPAVEAKTNEALNIGDVTGSAPAATETLTAPEKPAKAAKKAASKTAE